MPRDPLSYDSETVKGFREGGGGVSTKQRVYQDYPAQMFVAAPKIATFI